MILFPENSHNSNIEPLLRAAKSVPDNPAVCTIYAHGAPGLITPTDRKSDAISISLLKKIIDEKCKPKQPVQLMSCDGGTGGDDSVAAKLAKESGRTVSGYDGLVHYRAPLFPFSGTVTPIPGVRNVTYGSK